jgi:UDP-N-acetylglucosamine 2-epimerase
VKIVSIVGARPEFVQAAPVSAALRRDHQEVLVHTGQHYDYAMSQTFFDELDVPAPDYNLEVGSGAHGEQTAAMLAALEALLTAEKPDMVLVRGDTNSTLAGALAAAKMGIPIAHVEAGERSFDRRMPEEINRVLADHLASIHFCVSPKAQSHLAAEGIIQNVHVTGDVMYDSVLRNLPIARKRSMVLETLKIAPLHYALATVHRAANTDDPHRLRNIVEALNESGETVVFPVHPRTLRALQKANVQFAANVRQIEPVGYFDMMVLAENARLVATDSGGVQREAYYLARPCITLRDETEWTETVDAGWNRLVGADKSKILDAWRNMAPPAVHPPVLGDGQAAARIARKLTDWAASKGDSERNAESEKHARVYA